MHRRTFLGGTAAAALAGCTPAFYPATIRQEWPPLGTFTEVEGLRVHHTDQGKGTPVILVHGASGNLRDMTFALSGAVAERRRAIAMDRPGFGYSDRPAERGFDPAVQARILRGAAKGMGIDRAIVVGHSWGGALAMAWALQFPDEVAGLVILSGATMPWGGDVSLFYSLGDAPVIGPIIGSAVRAFADQDAIDGVVQRVFNPQVPPPGYAHYVGGPLATRDETIRANAQDIQNLNEILAYQSESYGRVQAQTEILHGTRDEIVSLHVHAIPLSTKVPGANLTLLDGIGHMPHHVSIPEVLAALDRIDPSPA